MEIYTAQWIDMLRYTPHWIKDELVDAEFSISPFREVAYGVVTVGYINQRLGFIHQPMAGNLAAGTVLCLSAQRWC
jgi:hypothetical protein